MATETTSPPAGEPTMHSQASHELLDAMRNTATWGHPDLYGEFTGMRYYAAGNYKAAMKYFLLGAEYADKLSQLSIGLMYLNGEGVRKDPVQAFAWVALAAERKYPKYLATRDAIWSTLDAAQREQAKALVEKLYPEYGDATAKRALANRMRWGLQQYSAGSLLGGHPIGSPKVVFVPPSATKRDCSAKTISGLPVAGCGNLDQASWYWNPKEYFEMRDAEMRGTVTVGQLKQLPDKPADTPSTPHK